MISDEELLTAVVRESLHKLYPAIEDGTTFEPPTRARLRFGYVVYGALTALVIAGIVAGAALLPHAGRPVTPAPLASVSVTPPPSPVSAPAWTQACVRPGVRADQLIGQTLDRAEQLAAAQQITVIVTGLNGGCLPIGAKAYRNPVWVAVQHGIVVEARYEGWSGPPK